MDLGVWRDISLLWLISLTFIAVLPFAVLFFFVIKGLQRLRQVVKRVLPVAQEKARLVADKTDQISLKVTQPIIGAHARAAQVNSVRKAILTWRQRP